MTKPKKLKYKLEFFLDDLWKIIVLFTFGLPFVIENLLSIRLGSKKYRRTRMNGRFQPKLEILNLN